MKKNKHTLTDLLGGVLLPVWTAVLVLMDDPLTTNLSWIGNGFGKRTAVLVWAVAGALIYRSLIHTLAESFSLKLKRKENLVYVLMILSLVVPYLPDSYPWLSQLHIFLGYISFALLSINILYVFYQGQLRGWKICQAGITAVSVILLVCALLYITFLSINSVLELFYTVSMAWTLIHVTHTIEKAEA